jgi:uncharacterized DUF497 family protein
MKSAPENDWNFFLQFLEETDWNRALAEKEGGSDLEVYPASAAIREKIEGSKHHLPFEEVQEVFYNPAPPPLISKARDNKQRAIGESFAGRAIVVIFVRDQNENIRVISARDHLSKAENTLLSQHKQRRILK